MDWTVGKWSSVPRFHGTSWEPDKIRGVDRPSLIFAMDLDI